VVVCVFGFYGVSLYVCVGFVRVGVYVIVFSVYVCVCLGFVVCKCVYVWVFNVCKCVCVGFLVCPCVYMCGICNV